MAEERKQSEIASRQTNATTRRIKVRLDKIKVNLDRYCHRDRAELSEESLQGMCESLVRENGIQVPIEVYIDPHGPPDESELIKGHRRVFGSRYNAAKNVPGFKPDMELDALEVVESTPVDRLIRSIADNEVRLNLDKIGRIRVVKKLFDAGVQDERAACAMNISVSTYRRALIIAKHPWMLQHIEDGSIELTHGSDLLALAEEHGCLNEMREDLDAWVADKKRKNRDKEKLQKARGGSDFSAAEKQVKKYMPKHLVEHWKTLLKNHQRFDEAAEWNYAASVEPEKEQLKISAVTLDLGKAPLDQLAKIASKLSLVTKQMVPFIRKAKQKESDTATSTAVEAAYDLEFLRDLGLDEYASDLESQTRPSTEPDGEESPQDQPAERQETDLTADVQLPTSDGAESPKEQPTERQEQDLTAEVQLPPSDNTSTQDDAKKE